MSQHRHLYPLLAVAVLLAAACSSPRKASERACAKAAKYRAKAIWLCPQALVMDSAEVRFQLPGDSATHTARYTEPQVDSLIAACAQYAEALAAERDLYQAAMQQQLTLAHEGVVRSETTKKQHGGSKAAQEALLRIREEACHFEPLEATVGYCRARVRPGGSAPLLTLEQLPMDVVASAPCPPQLGEPRVADGVARWYRTGFWIVLGLCLLLLAALVRMVMVCMRRTAMAAILCTVLMVCAADTMAQDPTRTVSERKPGQRTLVLNGTFVGADSAYGQVYHDGKEVLADYFVGTWALTFGTYDYYHIKFTDAKGRIKRISIHELSDDMVEFYPPIEVDFERMGNLVIIKQSHGKPDWIEYDVGMSRPRKAR